MKSALVGILLLSSALALSACGKAWSNLVSPSYEAQEDCGFVQNVYGQRISWKGHTPIRLAIHESVPKEFYPGIEAALHDWEAAVGHPLFQVTEYGLKGPANPRQDGQSVIYWMGTWDEKRANEQALTSVYWVGDEIREADLKINAKDFSFYVDKTKTSRDVHLESLIVHELGHVLGLKHRDSSGSVMATYLASSTTRDSISKTDVDSMRCEY